MCRNNIEPEPALKQKTPRHGAGFLLSGAFPRAALERIEQGGEAEGMVRMLELLSQARGYVRRSRLERELELFTTEPPFSTMSEEQRARLIHEQTLIVQFAPEKAQASLPALLNTPKERKRALELVMRVVGPAETMHPRAFELYREFEAQLSGKAKVPAVTAEQAA